MQARHRATLTGYNPDLAGPVRVELPIAGLLCATCVTAVQRSLDLGPYKLGLRSVTGAPDVFLARVG